MSDLNSTIDTVRLYCLTILQHRTLTLLGEGQMLHETVQGGTCIFCCGYHRDKVTNWEDVMWGYLSPFCRAKLGRIPTALRLACQIENSVIMFGGSNGEAQNSYNIAHKRGGELIQYLATKDSLDSYGEENLRRRLGRLLHERFMLDKMGANTRKEMKSALEFCYKEELEKLIIVTSLAHGPRCIAELRDHIRQDYDRFGSVEIQTSFSQVDHAAGDLAVFEPSAPLKNGESSFPFNTVAKELCSFVYSRPPEARRSVGSQISMIIPSSS